LLTCYDEIGIESGREAAHRGQKNVSVVVVAERERGGKHAASIKLHLPHGPDHRPAKPMSTTGSCCTSATFNIMHT
jgi:hypothetical protein